jgi:hypothetical protein
VHTDPCTNQDSDRRLPTRRRRTLRGALSALAAPDLARGSTRRRKPLQGCLVRRSHPLSSQLAGSEMFRGAWIPRELHNPFARRGEVNL